MRTGFFMMAASFYAVLVIAAGKAQAMEQSCMAPAPLRVDVTVSEKPAYFDLGKSSQDLEIFKNAANAGHLPSPYHGKSDIRGVTVGHFSAEQDVSFGYGDAIGSDERCVMIRDIDVTLSFKPVVYVASAYKNHECWFSEIFGHEAKHVGVDRILVADYTDEIERTLGFAFEKPDSYSSGHIAAADMENAKTRLQQAVSGALSEIFDKMMRDRAERQLAVDNVQEYIRIARACPEVNVDQAVPTFLSMPETTPVTVPATSPSSALDY